MAPENIGFKIDESFENKKALLKNALELLTDNTFSSLVFT